MNSVFEELGGSVEPVEPSPVTSASPASNPFEELGGSVDPVPQKSTSAPDVFSELGGSIEGTPAMPAEGTPSGVLKSANAITHEKVDEVARRHGVDPQTLRDLTPFFGAYVDTPEGLGVQDVKRAVGIAGRGLLSIPQGLIRASHTPQMRSALDEIGELTEQSKTGLQKAVEFAGEFGVGGAALAPLSLAGKAPTVAKLVAEGAGLGAVQGAATAKEGEVAQGTTTGSVLGAGLGLAGAGIGRLVKSLTKAGVDPAEALNLEKQVQEHMQKPEVSESVQSGEKRALDIARETEPSAAVSTELHPADKLPPVTPEEAVAANPDLAESVESGRFTPEQATEQAARRELQAEHTHDLVDFAKYTEAGELPEIRTAAELEKAVTPLKLAEAQARLKQSLISEGEEGFSRLYRDFRESKAAAELNEELLARTGPTFSSAPAKLGRMFLRVRGMAKIIDDRAGTTLEPLMDKLSTQGFLKNWAMHKEIARGASMRKAVEEAGLNRLSVDQLAALEAGDLSSLSPEQVKAFEAWTRTNEALREQVNKLGRPVSKAAGAVNYVPHMEVDKPTAMARTRMLMDAVEKKSGVQWNAHFSDEAMQRMEAKAPEEFAKLKEGLEYITGKPIESATDLARTAHDAINPRGIDGLVSGRLMRQASSQQQRVGSGRIPTYLRETNLNKLQIRWMNENFQDAYMRRTVQEIVRQRNSLNSVGDEAGASYINQLLADMSGPKRGVAGAVARKKAQWTATALVRSEQAQAAGNKRAAALWGSIATNPDLPGLFGSAMYGNLLGFSPKTFILSMSQPFLTTLPELTAGGTPWAAAKFTGGYLKTIKELATKGHGALQIMEERGYMPPHLSSEAVDAFKTGMEKGTLNKLTRNVLEKYSNISMAMLQASEVVNRIVVINSAEGIARDMIAGSPSAVKFINSVGRGYAYKFNELVKARDMQGLEKLVADYMVGKTAIHYSPHMMNELGRYFGRLVGAFSTWPSTVTADIVGDFARHGAAGGLGATARKYLAPLGGLMVLDKLLESQGVTPDESPRMKVLLGKQGFKSLSPLTSVTEMGTKEGMPIRSPYLDAGFHTITALASGDPAKWWEAVNKAGEIFVPGTSIIKLLDTTIPGLVGNKSRKSEARSMSGRALDLVNPGAGQRLEDRMRKQQ